MNSKEIKEYISKVLNTKEIKENFICVNCIETNNGDDVIELENVDKHIQDKHFNEFLNPSNWKRGEKRKLKENWDSYFRKEGFSIVEFGDYNTKLVEYYYTNPMQAQKCILRVFWLQSYIASIDYRIEVVTTPNDDEVIGWTAITD